ncbi:MAG: hypothetical protein ACRDPE_15230 [Solirubrobacterales bacterium]
MGIVDGIRERLEEAAGVSIRPANEVHLQEAEFQTMTAFVEEAEDLAIHALGYMEGRPHEMRADRRRELSQRSRVAYLKDPLAGAEGDMRANFAFGRGISKPTAKEPEVQTVVDRFWTDPVNQKKLTSFEAQRLRSNDLLTQGNLLAAYFENNGRIRVAFLDADIVTDVIVSQDDDELPLWYTARKKKREWDYNRDAEKPQPYEVGPNGLGKVSYYEHWRNVALAERDAADVGEVFDEKPNPSKIAPGKVEHFRVNRVGRTQFGVPPWNRTLRYFSAMNQFNEARVSMAQAAASIVAKRVVRGGAKGVVKAAGNVLTQAGQLGRANFGGGQPIGGGAPGRPAGRGDRPPPPGSIWTENESDSLQAMNFNSGGPAASADQSIILSPIAAAAGFGPHYFGNLSDANLAGATTLELPTLMNVSSWQELFEQIIRFYINRSIESAVHAGHLGGLIAESETADSRPLTDLVYEEDREEMERRTGKDLSYSFSMPYPGRRNLPDVINVSTAAVEEFDPEGKNPWLRRYFLDFLLQALEVEDPAGALDQIMPLPDGMETAPPELALEALIRSQEAPEPPEGEGEPEEGNGSRSAPRSGKPSEQASQNGERTRSTPPAREMGGSGGREVAEDLVEDATSDLARALEDDVDDEFTQLLKDPMAFLQGRPAPPAKGHLNGQPTPGS